MRVLVTGHQGKIGGHLVPALVGAGHEVRGSDIKSGGDILAPNFAYDATYDYYPEAIIHLAPVGDPVVLEMVEEIECRLVMALSAGVSQLVAEVLAATLGVVVLGIATCYGPGMGGVVGEFIEMEKRSRPGTENPPGCTIYGDGLQTRDFIYVDDVVRAFTEAVKMESGYVEVATGTPTSVFELFRLLTYEWGYTPKLTYADALPGEVQPPLLRCDLPWEPTKLEEGLARVVKGG